MKMITGIKLSLLVGMVYAQSIQETLEQISALKAEISQSEDLVEKKIADMKRTNPLFAEQDAFESDAEYLGRMSRAMPQFDRLRKQYLGDLWKKMSILRGRMFETSDITVTLDKNLYDANTEKWPIVIQHNGYQKERIEQSISITKNNAREFYKNWDKVQKTGVLTVDVGDKIGLAKFRLFDPISGFEFKHEFRPMKFFKSGNEVNSVAFSPDGKFLASGSSDYYARIYNLETGQEVNKFKQRRYGSATSVVFSPDGKFLASGSNDHYAHIYNLETGQEVNSFIAGDDVNSVAFSPDGKFLAVGSDDKKAHIYNLEKGDEVSSFIAGDDVNSVAFSPDGKFLAAGSDDNKAHVYNLETVKEVKSFKFSHDVNSVAFSPDGKFLAAGSDDKKAHIYNLETDKELNNFGYDKTVWFVTFSDDGRYLALNSSGIDIYDLSTSKKVRQFGGHRSIDFSPDGKYLATCYNKTFRIYRTLFQVEEEVLAQKAISRPPALSASVSFSEPSGNQFLDAMETGAITLTIKNKGDGSGKGLLAKISPERTDNLNYNNTYIEEIHPGKSVSVDIPLEAYIGIADGDHTFRIDFEEINGFPPDPVELPFSTKAYLKPELYLMHLDLELGDKNENEKIDAGEMIDLTVHIGNKGDGTAKNAYAKLYAGDNVYITEKNPKIVSLGEIPTGSVIEIPLEFFVNNKTLDAVPLYMDLTEETNLANVSKLRLPISLSEGIRKIDVTVIKKDGSKITGFIMEKTPEFVLIQDQDKNTVKIPVDEIEVMSSGIQKN